MSTRRNIAILGIAAAVATVVGLTYAVASAANPKFAPVQYSAPFVCGWLPPVPPQDDQHLKPGDYATAINIHNHTSVNVNGSWQMGLLYRDGGGVPPAIQFVDISVRNRRVLEIDCVEIWARAGLPPGTFFSGALFIGLDQQLPIAGIYTSQTHVDPALGPDAGAGLSIDVESILPFGVAP